MLNPPLRTVALASALICGLVLGTAWSSEHWGGLVPCALCLLERWPYRIAIALGLLAAVTPPRVGRLLLGLLALTILADAAIGFLHVGVEFHWWPSPLPECAAPKFTRGSVADWLASMPAHPAKPCDEPVFLISWLPVSMAQMNTLFCLGFSAALGAWLRPGRRAA